MRPSWRLLHAIAVCALRPRTASAARVDSHAAARKRLDVESWVAGESRGAQKGHPFEYGELCSTRNCRELLSTRDCNTESDTYSQPQVCKAITIIDGTLPLCVDNSPWKNVIESLVRHDSGDTQDDAVRKLVNQAINHVANPVTQIRQRSQSFCGTAAFVFMYSVATPMDYTAMLISLFCDGKWTAHSDARSVNSTENFFSKVKDDLFGDNEENLIKKKDIGKLKIEAIDWMTMAAMRNSAGMLGNLERFFWTTAANKKMQGTGSAHAENYFKMLFNAPVNEDKGSHKVVDCWGKPPSCVKLNQFTDWGKNAYALLPFHMHVAWGQEGREKFLKEKKGISNHACVLVHVLSIGGIDWCYTWTWGQIYQDRCTDLALFMQEVWVADFKTMQAKKVLQPDVFNLDRIKELKQQIVAKVNGRYKFNPLIGEVGDEFK